MSEICRRCGLSLNNHGIFFGTPSSDWKVLQADFEDLETTGLYCPNKSTWVNS